MNKPRPSKRRKRVVPQHHYLLHGFALISVISMSFGLSGIVTTNPEFRYVVFGAFALGLAYIYAMLAVSFYIRKVKEEDHGQGISARDFF